MFYFSRGKFWSVSRPRKTMFDHLQSLVWLNNGNQFLVEYFLNYFAGRQKGMLLYHFKTFFFFFEEYIEVSQDHVTPRSTIFNSDLVLVDLFRLNLMSLSRTGQNQSVCKFFYGIKILKDWDTASSSYIHTAKILSKQLKPLFFWLLVA